MSSLQSAPSFDDLFASYGPNYQPLPDSVRLATPGFSGATVLCLETSRGPCALRFWPEAGPEQARWETIGHFLIQMQKRGVPELAPPIRRVDGRLCGFWAGRLVHLEPWRPGQPVTQPAEWQQAAVGEILARLHLTAATFVPNAAESVWLAKSCVHFSPALVSRRRQLRELLGPGGGEQLAAEVFSQPDGSWMSRLCRFQQQLQVWGEPLEQQLQQFAAITLPLQPVLRDVWRDHLLFSADQLTGLIDAGACRTDSVLCDLSRCLGSLFGNQSVGWEAVLTCYQTQRPLALIERQALPVFDLSNLLLSARGCFRLLARLAAEQSASNRFNLSGAFPGLAADLTRAPASELFTTSLTASLTASFPASLNAASAPPALLARLQQRLDEYLQRLETYRPFLADLQRILQLPG